MSLFRHTLRAALGYGGMISFGHAAYLGIGAYAVAVMSFYEIDNGWLQLPVAIPDTYGARSPPTGQMGPGSLSSPARHALTASGVRSRSYDGRSSVALVVESSAGQAYKASHWPGASARRSAALVDRAGLMMADA